MELTKVRIRKTNKNGLLGVADITLDDAITITGIRIVDSAKGRFLVFPERKLKNKNPKKDKNPNVSVVFPIHKEIRDLITKKVLEEFDAMDVKPKGEPEAIEQNSDSVLGL